MAKVLVYYAHPGNQYSRVNKAMSKQAKALSEITFVDLYAEYPRFNIDVEQEQKRLLAHDVIVFQFPMFWYSTPALIKEWLDLVLEYGFAYGKNGTNLKGKTMMLAVTAAGSAEAYSTDGHHQQSMRTFLTPLEQTANLCQMQFIPPYVLYASLSHAEPARVQSHAAAYKALLLALFHDQFDVEAAKARDVLGFDDLPIKGGQ
ncbi:MAG: potassium transporter KefG [Zetaproteobacteria bacterium CG2_30_46_52]|nr:MAG: potassium transporter KefG [Zetaproteobacteria bacterium CG2_30_46_52]